MFESLFVKTMSASSSREKDAAALLQNLSGRILLKLLHNIWLLYSRYTSNSTLAASQYYPFFALLNLQM